MVQPNGEIVIGADDILFTEGFYADAYTDVIIIPQGCNPVYDGSRLKSRKYSEDNIFENKIETVDDIKLYPNPNSGSFTVELYDNSDVIHKISVYSATSRLVKELLRNGTKQANVEVKNLTPGLYFVKTFTTNNVYINRVVIRE